MSDNDYSSGSETFEKKTTKKRLDSDDEGEVEGEIDENVSENESSENESEVDESENESEIIDVTDDSDMENINEDNLFDDAPVKSVTKKRQTKTQLNEDIPENLFDSDFGDDEDDDDDEDEDGTKYLQKIKTEIKQDVIRDYHPELVQHNYEEVEALCVIVRDQQGRIVDPLHKTLPFLTKYEKARILGERAKQINGGAKPFVNLGPEVIDGFLIAQAELEQKKIPFIVRRPLQNGGCEYWKLKDLEII